jgi:hypothetical protein
MPLSNLPEQIIEPLGMSPADVIIIEGTPGLSFGLSGRAGFRASDLKLRAKLPPMAPPNAPAWFVDGELSLKITGRPSISLVGSVTILDQAEGEVQGQELEFFVRGTIGRDGPNFALSLAGGMVADGGWHAPFGIRWMTLNEVVVKISINATGSLGLGFSADLVVGEKDIDVACFVAVNLYTGVPTNFIFEGRSEEGIALSDLVKMQQAMARAINPNAPRLPVDRLPDAALRNLHLKFAPKDDPDLGVEAGLSIGGDLLVRKTFAGPMEYLAGVHLSISRDGIVGNGYIGDIYVGPFGCDDASVDLALTVPTQRFAIQGKAWIGANYAEVDIEITPAGLLESFLDRFLESHGATIEAALGKLEDAGHAAGQLAEQAKAAAERKAAEARAKAEEARAKAEQAAEQARIAAEQKAAEAAAQVSAAAQTVQRVFRGWWR